MRRIPELDALRGAAALVVVVFHIGLLDGAFNVWFGWSAVDLFFVLSGYLITNILLAHRPTGPFYLAFYARRALRIWPVYYLGLIALMLVNPLLPVPEPWDSLPYYLTYTLNLPMYWFGAVPPVHRGLDHTWTLCIEEQFYLIWPVLIGLAGRKRAAPLAMAIVGLSIAARFAGWSHYILISRCDGFAVGGLLAAVLADPAAVARRRGLLAWAFAVIGLAAGAYLGWFVALGRPPRLPDPAFTAAMVTAFTFLYGSLIGLSVIYSGRRWLAPLRLAPLRAVGTISYGLYFYHVPVLIVLHAFAIDAGLGYPPSVQAAAFAGSLGLAVASWFLIERPILALKDIFPYEPSKAPASVALPTAAPTPA